MSRININANNDLRRRCPDDSAQMREHAARRIEPAISHMLQHIDRPLRVSNLSKAAGISSSHFFVLFKSATGCTPMGYFIQLRMQRARELLGTGYLHVKQVASTLGYDDQFYFSRQFKSVIGVSPSGYRLNLPSELARSSPPLKKSRRFPLCQFENQVQSFNK
jgi:transcriptional regulator GlxA family with amidase domain